MHISFCFNGFIFSPVKHQNTLWIRAAQLACALGFNREDKVAQIYQRHADEFTPDMTQLIEIVVEPQNEETENLSAGRCRIFSLRGCHLLAMFARTPIAKVFRKWCLDVIEEYGDKVPVEKPVTLNATPFITPSHQAQLKAIVDAKVGMLPSEMQRKAYAEIWSRFSRHFQIARYQQLPSEKMGEAVVYLVEMQINERKSLPQNKQVPAVIKRIDETPFIELVQEIQTAHEAVERILSPLEHKISMLSYFVSTELEKQANIQDRSIQNGFWKYLSSSMLSGISDAMIHPSRHLEPYANPGCSLLGIVRELNSARK